MTKPPAAADASGEVAALRAEVARLNRVATALMNRVEKNGATSGSDFGLFQTTIVLEAKVRERTEQLDQALRRNEQALDEIRHMHRELESAQSRIVQSEKMASIGLLAAGVAHEINNPIGFVSSNLTTLGRYVGELCELIDAYAALEPEVAAPDVLAAIAATKARIDLDFLRADLAELLRESQDGLQRVTRIVRNLKEFSHIDKAEWLPVDLNACLDSTLAIVAHEFAGKVDVIREYGALPPVECIAGRINQVFLNLLLNAAQAIGERGTVTLRSGAADDCVWIEVADTGCGIAPEVRPRIFDPFFTTRPGGKGSGLGLAQSFDIVDRHRGRFEVESILGAGSTFRVWLPIHRDDTAERAC